MKLLPMLFSPTLRTGPRESVGLFASGQNGSGAFFAAALGFTATRLLSTALVEGEE